MKFVLAFDKFKGSLSSVEAAEAAAEGIRRVLPDADCVVVPIADGGEGSTDALLSAMGGKRIVCSVTAPDGVSVIQAGYGILPDGSCVMEMAAAAGLSLLPLQKRNPLRTSTYGVGEMLRHALDCGCRRFLIGLGGSATNDGGMGMLAALGVRFFDENEQPILLPTGADLLRLGRIDADGLDVRLRECTLTICCDVDNPLYGSSGAAYVFAPQKGASAEDVVLLDAGLRRYAALVERCTGIRVDTLPGGGAAGGLGAGCTAFLHARLTSGIDAIAGAIGLPTLLSDADLLMTGEGCLDGQTLHDKTIAGLLRIAREADVPAVILGGCVLPEAAALYELGAAGIYALCDRPMPPEESMRRAGELLCARAQAIAATFCAARRKR